MLDKRIVEIEVKKRFPKREEEHQWGVWAGIGF